jgi:flagellar biosynthetic protein FlhB
MALFRDDAGRTEKPTPGRLGEARDKGQVPLSRELTMAGSLLVAILALEQAGPWFAGSLAEAVRAGLGLQLAARIDQAGIGGILAVMQRFAVIVAPPALFLAGIAVLATAVAGYAQIGFKLTPAALALRPERLNPATNLARLLSLDSVVRTLASAVKLGVLALVLWLVLAQRWPALATLPRHEDLGQSIGVVVDTSFALFFWIALVVFLLAFADVAWQRFSYTKGLMMTKQEVEDERKRTDGDPLIKSRQRTARLELMRQRMMEAVPKADVVITNPTHYAVALAYDRARHQAPELVAKGADDVAARIRELAREHGVPLLSDPPLARTLFRAVKVGQQIPERFYQAVATVLGHVWRLRGREV